MADDGELGLSPKLIEAESCASASFGSTSDCSQVTAYILIRVLGRGAFGEAVLYRKVEVELQCPGGLVAMEAVTLWFKLAKLMPLIYVS